jgi:hypothetical protein
VKGHSGQKWNERADALADEGAAKQASTAAASATVPAAAGGTARRNTVPAHPPQESQACISGAVRWLQREPTEASRIALSRTSHGTLNTHARRKKDMSQSEVRTLHARCRTRLWLERHAGTTTVEEHDRATTKLTRASQKMLTVPDHQKTERRARSKTLYTRELDCPVDVDRLEALVTAAGDTTWGSRAGGSAHKARTYKDTIEALLRHVVTHPDTGAHTLRIKYTYSTLGRDLFEAGHVTCSREYADGEDPFKWPRRLRDAAIGHLSVTYDDNAAFPRAKMAMVPEHSRMGTHFLRHRPQVYEQYGLHLFREVPDAAERRKRVKRMTNAYDMGAKLDSWAAQHTNPHKRSVNDMTAKVAHEGGTLRISLAVYHKEQQEGAALIEKRSESMAALIASLAKANTRAREKVGRTTQSYILQEAEAVSRLAKISKCRGLGLRVISLQHDGIATQRVAGGEAPARVAHLLGEAASEAAGYRVVVVDETIAPDAVLAD